ncbi:MAG: HYR domain-containing protein, partial [Bacteroidota bacterium]
MYHLASVACPTFVLEGEGGNTAALRTMKRRSRNEKLRWFEIAGADHFTLLHSLNTLLADNVDLVQFQASADAGSRLSVTIIDQTTGVICVGTIRLIDNLAPTIANCEEQTISCLDNSSPAVIGVPTVADNCATAADLDLDFIENFAIGNCFSDTAGVILREWTVTDNSGLQASCTQRINILRAMVMDVTFPADVTLPCDDPGADPLRTGMPLLNDTDIAHNGGPCGLTFDYMDDTTYICNDYMYRIDRTWTVTETCTAFSQTEEQLILVTDTQGPTLNCPTPDQLVFNTDGDDCGATIALPIISATDNCGSDFTFTVSSTYGASDFSPVSNVAPGLYTVTYQGMDECGNVSTCSTQLRVEDQNAPVAACNDQLLVSIPNAGLAVIQAITFDEGSSDNCNAVFYKVRRTDTGSCANARGDDSAAQAGVQEWFDDEVFFCCEDISNDPITVTLRVYALDPGTGPVDPTRETGSGDLVGNYTDCQSIVSIQDGSGPELLACPANVTITCGDPQDDWSIYGSPVVSENCLGFTVDSTLTVAFGECGEGTVTRTWTATDMQGMSTSCTQVITIENNDMLQETDITWPEHVTLEGCGVSTAIADLPVAAREPVITFAGCGSIAINETEALFHTVAGACYKILRTWTVIDWCHYNTSSPNGPGRYVHTQIIKVKDLDAPVLTCPPAVTANTGPDCATAAIVLALPTATDCSDEITFINLSPHAAENGADASGTYPEGITTVQFVAEDGCGNNASCTTTVTVGDTQGPQISCFIGMSVTLMYGENGAMAMLPAEALVASAQDNCTSTELLKYNINRTSDGLVPAAGTPELLLHCGDAESAQEVIVWANDEQNNFSSCTTVVLVQDPNEHCVVDEPQSGMIAGGVLTEDGIEVENVMVVVSGEAPDMMYTQVDGSFQFEELPLGNDYSIVAQNNEAHLNGVTTLDLIFISKHILGTRLLDSPYKLIAADVDRSGHVSTLDVIKLRKLILNLDDTFPNNTSWRFVDASYEFPDPTNPFLTYFPEIFNVNNLDGMEMHADFVAIKIGDVNGSVQANSLQGDGDARGQTPLVFSTKNQAVAADEIVEIAFEAEYLNEWMGYQFTLEYDPGALEVLEILPGDL